MEQLITISSVGFIISTILAIGGVALSIFTFLKYDIREVFIIRSGRGLKKAVLGMEKQRAISGTLRKTPQEADVKNKDKNSSIGKKEKTAVAEKHAPATAALKTAPATMPLSSAADTVPLWREDDRMAPETEQLQIFDDVALSRSEDEKKEKEAIDTLSGKNAEFSILSEEMEIHTDEKITSDNNK